MIGPNELTIEQIEEARDLSGEYGWGGYKLEPQELALLIAHIRTEAHNAALDSAAGAVDACGDYWGRMQIGEAVEAIRGIKL